MQHMYSCMFVYTCTHTHTQTDHMEEGKKALCCELHFDNFDNFVYRISDGKFMEERDM